MQRFENLNHCMKFPMLSQRIGKFWTVSQWKFVNNLEWILSIKQFSFAVDGDQMTSQ